MKYIVDLPTMNDFWDEAGVFDTREEAITFVRHNFGGDENGKVSLVTECDLDETLNYPDDLAGRPMPIEDEDD